MGETEETLDSRKDGREDDVMSGITEQAVLFNLRPALPLTSDTQARDPVTCVDCLLS